MSDGNKSTLKKVSSTDSIFSVCSKYECDNVYNVFEKCKTLKKGVEIIHLIEELRDNIMLLDSTESIDFFYQFENLFFLFSKKEKSIMPYLEEIGMILVKNIDEWAIPDIIEVLIIGLGHQSYKGDDARSTRKEYSLKLLDILTDMYPHHIKNNMVNLINPVSELTCDLVTAVKDAANKLLIKIINCNGNDDLKQFLPSVIKFFNRTLDVETVIDELASCIFVQDIELSALSIIEPIFVDGLKNRTSEIQRKSCVIIDNMCKLIEKPEDILPIALRLRPRLEKCTETISNPEAREMSKKSLVTLNKSISNADNIDTRLLNKTKDDIIKLFKDKINEEITIENIYSQEYLIKCFDYTCIILKNLANARIFDYKLWENSVDKYLKFMEAKDILIYIYDKCKITFEKKEYIFEDTEEGQDLYKGQFSLAYGALTLLNNSNMHLKRNRFYGLLGPNNCGKTTLMRAIANEQIEGFPKRDELKTIFVEHEIQEREVDEDNEGYPIFNIDLCGIDWVVDCCNEVYKMEPHVTRVQVEEVMEEIGFGNSKKDMGKDRAADAEMGVTTYSGGWKMKMQLCAATLMNTDILMLDEPTGHLDVKNIAWIKQWLRDFISNGGSVICTSHDSSFLDEMCTHIIDFESRKLRIFREKNGNVLKQFVEKYPEKKGYFELKNDVMKFKFPNPGYIDGLKSKGHIMLKMNNVTFQYPIRDKPTVFDINLACSRSSRVAVIGPNGAGKSTAIKLLIGELEPTSGKVSKHASLRLAYVAQHAFQHLEKHIKKTPTGYILWRFAGNDDKENVDFKKNRKIDEIVIVNKYYLKTAADSVIPGLVKCFGEAEEKKAVYPDKILARRELKKEKTKEYEVKWKDKDDTTWVKKELLIDMGAILMVHRQDEKEALAAGLMNKPLTSKEVEKHLLNFGIDAEQASHTQLGSLSGGQKVKVVLAASMWQNPHIVILDEPTNYLDRDGLGALTKAIEEFEGGVIIISHNREFANAVSQEKWIMEAGQLRREGESIVKDEEKQGNALIGDDVIFDSQGNEIKVNKSSIMTEKEKKIKIKQLQKKIKSGKKDNLLTENEIWEIEDEINELKCEN